MSKYKITKQDLKSIIFPSEAAKSISMNILTRHFKFHSRSEQLNLLSEVLENPELFSGDERWQTLVNCLIPVQHTEVQSFTLRENPLSYQIFGSQHIRTETCKQMDWAMSLPISVAGALMPDAHLGYGLPVGSVLCTSNAIIPYGVGVDIGCRMALSIYPETQAFFKRKSNQMRKALKEHTFFGKSDAGWLQDHQVLEDSLFKELGFLKNMQKKASFQLGSSGSGNHFVEFGEVHLEEKNELGLEPGIYLGLLSHSGSRNLGATVAEYYMKIALERCILPRQVAHFAWLSMDSAEGIEYFEAMNLAGRYAEACHEVIHQKLNRMLGLEPILNIANHHNFAWKEVIDGQTCYVHRKGSTPAHTGEYGIIPGSMTEPGFIVKGLGNKDSIFSASHGAGRKLSRKEASSSMTPGVLKKILADKNVDLIGGCLDEGPHAYKNLSEIMPSQLDLVEVLGKFIPRIVRMDDQS